MRISLLLISLLSAYSLVAQVTEKRDLPPLGVGVSTHGYIATRGGPAWSGKLRFRLGLAEVYGSYGSNKTQITGIRRGFEEIRAESDYWEAGLTVLFSLNQSGAAAISNKKDGNHLKISVGYMQANSDLDFIETFEVGGPYDDYIYQKSFPDVNERFFTTSMGFHSDFLEVMSVGVGMQGFIARERNSIASISRNVNAISGRSPVALYFEVGFLF